MLCEVASQLYEAIARNDIIAETCSKIACFMKTLNMSPLQFSKELWLKTFRCLPG